MTKNIRLSKDYKLPNNMQCIGGYDFFNYTIPSLKQDEFYKPTDIPNDPNNVPIYDSTQCNNIIKTIAIECYGLHCNNKSIKVPIAKANELLAMKFNILDPAFPNLNKIIEENIFEEVV